VPQSINPKAKRKGIYHESTKVRRHESFCIFFVLSIFRVLRLYALRRDVIILLKPFLQKAQTKDYLTPPFRLCGALDAGSLALPSGKLWMVHAVFPENT
jgi:hypothetical protein